MSLMKPLLPILSAAILSACLETPPVSEDPTATTISATAAPGERTYLFSWGMFGDPVFDRDVETFTARYAQTFGAPVAQARYGANSPRLSAPNGPAIQTDLARFANAAVDGDDLIVVMLTSHGVPNAMALQAQQNGPVANVSADALAELLQPLAADRQILILQACFSGSLIDELQSPNRIILTAAAADRSSFGCNPDSDNTWFIKALNQAMAEGGSWEQIFARTRSLVAADEAAQGVTPSNPQRFVGANMIDVWTR